LSDAFRVVTHTVTERHRKRNFSPGARRGMDIAYFQEIRRDAIGQRAPSRWVAHIEKVVFPVSKICNLKKRNKLYESAALALVLAAFGTAARAQNEAWDGRFDANGMSGTVRAVDIAPNGHVFAGGLFTTAGGAPASRVAEWDGASWTALGAGVSGDVYALRVDSQNNVYVGGAFTTAGGNLAGRIAMWNGGNWSDLDGGMTGVVYALAIDDDDNVYAGGAFTVAGGVPALRVAMWDGSNWSALGGGASGDVYALTTYGTNLYAGGAFTTAGGTAALRVARWNGLSWSALGAGASDIVWALAMAENGDLYAGGAFTTAGTVIAGRIARWDGGDWSDLDGGMSSDVFAIATSGTDVYAGGTFTTAGGSPAFRIAKWDGGGWSSLGDGTGQPSVRALAVQGIDLYAGGEFTTAGGKTSLYFGRYNPDIVPVFIQGFTARPSGDRVDLEWRTWADEAVAGHRLYRGSSRDAELSPLDSGRLLPADATSYSDTGVIPGVTYVYQLAVVKPDGTEILSPSVEATVPRTTFALEQNFPNPFNPITSIAFSGPKGVPVRLVVYDVRGRAVVTLFDGPSPGGRMELQWNGRDAAGAPVSSGVYFYRLTAYGLMAYGLTADGPTAPGPTGGKQTITRKMLLLK
jgi:hypothetical protein